MSGKISVLDIDINNYTAKEAMERAMDYLQSDPVSVIELFTVDDLMQLDGFPELKENVRKFDLVLAGDSTVLEAAEITNHKSLQETERHIFLKMFLRYLHKNHKRVYLLVESEEEGHRFYHYLEHTYGGVQIVGLAKVSAQNRADDMLVNVINGGEIDCVLSVLSTPLQEEFIAKNRSLLNARVWMGLGKGSFAAGTKGKGRISQFLTKRIFKKEMEKHRRNVEEQFLSAKSSL